MDAAIALAGFTPEQVERARRYHRPLYWAYLADVVASSALLVALAVGPPGDALFRLVNDLPWWVAVLCFTAMVVGASFLLRLPLSAWRGHVRERRWGFSTQSLGGWLQDRAKSLAVALLLTSLSMLGFIALSRAFPRTWPLVVAPAAAGLVALLAFVAPVVLEPLFNRFRPVEDQTLRAALQDLSRRAGVPVKEILVADASRRTRKENAYVSGLGGTRRVVLYDTLMARADDRQIGLVVAHELGHRRLRHVAIATAVGMTGMLGAVGIIWLLLRSESVLHAVGASDAADPRVVPFLLLAGWVLQLLTLPLASWLSRRWERAADRFSLDLTGDAELFVASHRDLALANLSDLQPPRLVYAVAFTHPSAPERMAMGRSWEKRQSSA